MLGIFHRFVNPSHNGDIEGINIKHSLPLMQLDSRHRKNRGPYTLTIRLTTPEICEYLRYTAQVQRLSSGEFEIIAPPPSPKIMETQNFTNPQPNILGPSPIVSTHSLQNICRQKLQNYRSSIYKILNFKNLQVHQMARVWPQWAVQGQRQPICVLPVCLDLKNESVSLYSRWAVFQIIVIFDFEVLL